MSNVPAVTGKHLIKALEKVGFKVVRSKGSHNFLQHTDGRCTMVPVQTGRRSVADFLLRLCVTAN
ncbi:MAG: type II toxin-antitoxin system HicA family toxin [Syntrophorhabdaceae bacterium]|nr:type II toxin-antitoxin system HicA family toxin [Syntrophorhabdaceae bacterium]